jgi:peptide/nickel transport system ATP-binding protein
VNDVSFKLYEGETLGLVGERLEKSTLGNAILQLSKATGTILWVDITKLGNAAIKKLKEIQIIFKDTLL